MEGDFSHFPPALLGRANLAGNEYAWPVTEIPAVIAATEAANLVSVGGQLQFRLPEGVCECYWVEVDTYRDVPKTAPWQERVEKTAASATEQFAQLRQDFDFAEEGRKAFSAHLIAAERQGVSTASAMCFVWYVLNAEEAARQGA
jgi:hypothetical protein